MFDDSIVIEKATNGFKGAISHKLMNRGDGTLLARIRPNRAELFYRYKDPGESNYRYHKVGNHHLNTPQGITVQKALSEAQRLADLRREGCELDDYLSQTKVKKEVKKKKTVKKKSATFEQLLNDYTEIHLKDRRSYYSVKVSLKKHILDEPRFKHLIHSPANEVTPAHIVQIISRMIHELGLKQQCNRVRSYLSSAFSWGIKHDYNPALATTEREGIKYNIQFNPVLNIPVQEDFETYGKPQLSDRQIWLLWNYCLPTMGKAGHLAQLLLALGGIRQEHVLNTPWKKIVLSGKYPHMKLISRKGRGSKEYEYIVPLNKTALAIFKHLKIVYGHCEYPIPASRGSGDVIDRPLSKDTFDKPLKRFRAFIRDNIGAEVPNFSLGMIRGTVSTRMHEAKVAKEIKEKLQGHNQKDVTTKHYDVWQYKEEKLQASLKWEKYLLKLVNQPYDQVTDRLPEQH